MNQAFNNKLVAWLKYLLPDLANGTIIQSDQNFAAPLSPYATFRIDGFSKIAKERSSALTYDADANTAKKEVCQWQEFTLTINIIGDYNNRNQPQFLMQELIQRLDHVEPRVDALAPDVTYLRIIQDAIDVSAIVKEQFEPRMQIALRMAIATQSSYDAAWFDTMNINYELNGSIEGSVTITEAS